MNQPTATPQSVQARAAAALTQLLTEHPDAPSIVWQIPPQPRFGPALIGQVAADADPRATVAAWAHALGVEATEEARYLKATGERWTDVRASLISGGAHIEVWAMADRVEAPAVAA